MDKQYLSDRLTDYYAILKKNGTISPSITDSLVILSFLEELLYNDYSIHLDKDEYHLIDLYLNELFGEQCLLPYPEYKGLFSSNDSNNISIVNTSNIRITQNCNTRFYNNNIRVAVL